MAAGRKRNWIRHVDPQSWVGDAFFFFFFSFFFRFFFFTGFDMCLLSCLLQLPFLFYSMQMKHDNYIHCTHLSCTFMHVEISRTHIKLCTTFPAMSKGKSMREVFSKAAPEHGHEWGCRAGSGRRKQCLGFHTISPLRKSSALPLSPSQDLCEKGLTTKR